MIIRCAQPTWGGYDELVCLAMNNYGSNFGNGNISSSGRSIPRATMALVDAAAAAIDDTDPVLAGCSCLF